MSEVLATRTPISVPDYVRTAAASIRNLGDKPTPEALAIIWGHYYGETSNQNVYNFNYGNRRYFGGNDPPNYVLLDKAWECAEPGKIPAGSRTTDEPNRCAEGQVMYYPPAADQRFAAFSSPTEGWDSYFRFLKRKYPKAYAAALAGDPEGFIKNLAGYGTIGWDRYRSYFLNNYNKFRAEIVGAASNISSGGASFLGVAGAAFLLYLVVRKGRGR